MINTLQAVVEACLLGKSLLPPNGRLVFVWSIRTRAEAEPFADLLSALLTKAAHCNAPIELKLYETRPSKATTGTQAGSRKLSTAAVVVDTLREPLLEPDDNVEVGDVNSFEFLPGRPKMNAILTPDTARAETAADVAVYTCGPGPLVDGVVVLCRQKNFVCHTETFLF